MRQLQQKTIYEALGRDPVHPFPARMAPEIALRVMSDFDRSRVLDPMVGSGTVLALARAQRHSGVGFDVDPLAVLIAKVWTRAHDVDKVRNGAHRVLHESLSDFRNLSVGEAYPDGADDETSQFIRYWFDGYARRQLTCLASNIRFERCENTRDALWCAFSRLIISKQSGASRAMDLSHSRPHRVFATAPEKPFNKFLDAVERVIGNVIDKRETDRGPATVIKLGDARALNLPDESIDLTLTSPPYLNAIDYIRCSKFSLVWMGHNIGDLRRIRSGSIGTESGSESAIDDDREIRGIIDTLRLRPKLNRRYQRILGRYIDDMRSAIAEVGRVLSPGGMAVYVVGENMVHGTYIRTSVIVRKLAELAGLSLKERRTRMLPANRRYMPPPSAGHSGGTIEARMRREIILSFAK
jgi:SAM-dependent methyltransferase